MPNQLNWNGHSLPAFLAPRQIIEILNCSRSIVYELIASGEIPSLRIGRALRVPTADFLAWVERNMRSSVA